MATNTGNRIYAKLLKVTNDGTLRALDDNNNLVSLTGLPQSEKANTSSDPDYIPPFEDLSACPLPEAPVDCAVSEWSEWSACSVEGTQSRSRTVTTQPSGGGASCPVLTETQSCTYVPPTSSYYYEGIWELGDPAHPAGGSLSYVDATGTPQSITGMWAGNCIGVESQSEPTNKVDVAPCTP